MWSTWGKIHVCGSDEGIPSSLPSSPIDDIADRVDVQDEPNDLRIGSITRARAKLLEQQVNSLLVEYNIFTNETFILPKSLHVCMIRFEAEASMARGGEEIREDYCKLVFIIKKCAREERDAGTPLLRKSSWKSSRIRFWQPEDLKLKQLQISYPNSELYK